jgi:hypothetical protein
MKTIFTILSVLAFSVCFGQKKSSDADTIRRLILKGTSYSYKNWQDTVRVAAWCMTDTATLKMEWKKLYGVYGNDIPSVNINGIMLYRYYLMPDRKTPVTFKVIYSIKL